MTWALTKVGAFFINEGTDMAKRIGVTLALDQSNKVAAGMKNARDAAKNLDSELKTLGTEFKGAANSMEYLKERQKQLEREQEAYNRAFTDKRRKQK